MQLPTVCSSSSGFLRVFSGSFGGSVGLNHATVKLSTGTVMLSAASPLSVLSCKCQHESSGQKQEYQNGWFPAPAVTFRHYS